MKQAVTVAVTDLEYDKARAVFEAAGPSGLRCVRCPEDELGLAAAVRTHNARHAVVGVTQYSGALYEALPAGGVLARFGVGHDGIDKAAATRARILCTNTPGALDDSVAEYAIALILAAARHIPTITAAVRSGTWRPIIGCELRGRTLAIIGCGAIGSRVGRIASAGLGMRVIGCDPRQLDGEKMRREAGFERLEQQFDGVAGEADFVSLHIPSDASTRHFVNADRLAAMRPGAWLINTARGAVVDENALFDALKAGRLGGAALDVAEREPYEPGDPGRDLRTLPNVIMSPHVSSSTLEACNRMAEIALRNIAAAERSAYDTMNLLNPDVVAALGSRENR